MDFGQIKTIQDKIAARKSKFNQDLNGQLIASGRKKVGSVCVKVTLSHGEKPDVRGRAITGVGQRLNTSISMSVFIEKIVFHSWSSGLRYRDDDKSPSSPV